MQKLPSQEKIEAICEIGEDLDKAFREQPGLRAWLGGCYVQAVDTTRRKKNQLAVLRAELSDKARRVLEGRLNKDQIEHYVIQRKEYQAVQSELFDAEHIEDMLDSGLKALEHRRDALVALSANMRREWEDREITVRGLRGSRRA